MDDVVSSAPQSTPRKAPRQARIPPPSGNGAHGFADTYAEWDEEPTIAAIERALRRAGDVVRLEAGPDFPARLRETNPDIVFNFAEGMGGASRESHVPSFCEFWGIPYTGSDPLTLGLCLDKARAKEALSYHGIPTPEFQVVESPGELGASTAFPVIVKPLHEGSSKGITEKSLCRSRKQAEREVARVVERYREPAIVERFLSGREFTVAILGNDGDSQVLPVVELDFSALPQGANPLYGYEAKWVWDRPEAPLQIFHCPARCSPELRARIEEVAQAAFHELRCRDWARIDVRCDESGNPHIIEVNPLPGVLPDPNANSCFPKAARAAGLTFDEVIVTVLQAAAKRYRLVTHV